MKRLLFLIIALTLLLPGLAEAYIASPQYGAFELKFGPYFPAVDRNPLAGIPPGDEPYREIFGNSRMFLTMLELDWQIAHPPGFSIGVAGSVGFMQAYARAETLATGDPSSDYNVLNVIPFAALGVIRIDVLADEVHIPLVPYFKGGLNWYYWWVLAAGDTTGKGGTLGWQLSPGVMLRLDDFDRMSARTFDNEVGANHSYLFFELLYAVVDRFGDHAYMNLSTKSQAADMTFLIGVAVEF